MPLFSGIITCYTLRDKLRLVKFTFIILALFLSSFVTSAFGQTVADEPYKLPSNSSGEENSALTDGIAIEARQNGERLFVIVRLGKGETSRQLNQARLFNVKSFMLRKGFTQETAVFAEGERVEGEGRIEYYLGSKLKLITLAPRNKIPNLTCCEDYMPPVKRKPKRKKRKS
jgi:hypothetical protein